MLTTITLILSILSLDKRYMHNETDVNDTIYCERQPTNNQLHFLPTRSSITRHARIMDALRWLCDLSLSLVVIVFAGFCKLLCVELHFTLLDR